MLTCTKANTEPFAGSGIFAQEDDSGNVTYTNIAPASDIPRGTKSNLSVQNSTVTIAPTPKVKTSNNSIYKISAEVQSKRDDKRRTILLSELEQEQQALIVSQSKNDAVDADSHIRNISLLKKELGISN